MSTVVKSLNRAMHTLLEDERVVFLGEDILDPYGGAFKVAKGLSTRFPERVITTPIAEAGFVGIAAGMAMRGMRPIVEIMFGDFLMLTADQILNHIAKYKWMYNDQVEVPIVIRAAMGGRRGYGPTHSQSLEKHFLGMPGIVLVAPSPYHDPGDLLEKATLEDERPILFIENKLMYARPLKIEQEGKCGDFSIKKTDKRYTTVSLSYDDFQTADVTILAYGGMVELAVQAAEMLMMEEEIFAEVILPSCIKPLDYSPILDSLKRSQKLVVCEEATKTAGWRSEVIAELTKYHFGLLKKAPVHIGARSFPIANTVTLEEKILPQALDIFEAAKA